NAPAGRATTGGLFIGADRPLAMGWRLGGALGYSHTHVSVAERATKAGIDNYSLALYGGRQWQTGLGKLSLLLGASHTLHRIHSDR
ncbi:autotransporter outer membrane beta-barrel domain-containing protein, partial [Bordetella pseudohinzii]|uniref:autotransporter outer membrane beta-barrel domain-containing protein n=1 Tax=Bordetella pseudohinzii TaxID=1331258 RepID=UPI0019402304